MKDLTVAPERVDHPETGIYVRAKYEGQWVSADIAHLDSGSLVAWLEETGSAIDVVGVLLGHGHLTKDKEASE